jgi:hypothetical protein
VPTTAPAICEDALKNAATKPTRARPEGEPSGRELTRNGSVAPTFLDQQKLSPLGILAGCPCLIHVFLMLGFTTISDRLAVASLR